MKRDSDAPKKEEVRRAMRLQLRKISDAFRAEASLVICGLAAQLPAFRDGRCPALFVPLDTEPDIHPLIEEAWAQGKRVAFPFMSRDGETPHLQWLVAEGWNALVVAGPFGVREPEPALCPPLPPLELDCIFVPGLAFDPRGHRLGRGGAYYDAALAQLDVGTPRIGLMFSCQQVDEVPRDAHDQTLTSVVTESGVAYFD